MRTWSYLIGFSLCACGSLGFVADVAAGVVVSGDGNVKSEVRAVPAGFLRDRLAHRAVVPGLRPPRAVSKGMAGSDSLMLTGRLAGTWESVDGYVTFPYRFAGAPELGEMQILVRGFEVQPLPGGEEYRVEQWDRLAYWLRFDGNDPADTPRLVAAVELLEGFDPLTNTTYPELAQEQVVQDTCTQEACSVQWIPYVELKEDGRDYSAYPDGAAQAALLFVADAAGDAIAAVLDIFDAAGNLERTDNLYIGDEIKLYSNAYRLDEPDLRYLVEYVGFQRLDAGFLIERRHYIPNTDFLDSDLPADLEAGTRPMNFLLEGARSNGQGGSEFAYGGPYPLRLQWAQVPEFVFRGEFERAPVLTTASAVVGKSLVRRRTAKD